MIEYFYECDFELNQLSDYTHWISRLLLSENGKAGTINFIFCDDEYLLNVNNEYLKHDTYTDIVTFDYSDNNSIAGDIFISIDRVKENALTFKVKFENELLRVMAHGLLHLLGYNDKAEKERKLMRKKEDEKIKLFHVEHK